MALASYPNIFSKLDMLLFNRSPICCIFLGESPSLNGQHHHSPGLHWAERVAGRRFEDFLGRDAFGPAHLGAFGKNPAKRRPKPLAIAAVISGPNVPRCQEYSIVACIRIDSKHYYPGKLELAQLPHPCSSWFVTWYPKLTVFDCFLVLTNYLKIMVPREQTGTTVTVCGGSVCLKWVISNQ